MSLSTPYRQIAPYLEPIRRGHACISFQSPGGAMPPEGNLALRSALPAATAMDARPITGFNSQIPIPGIKSSGGAATIIFRVFGGTRLIKFWKDWSLRVYNPETDRVGLYSEVAGRGEIELYYADGKPAGIKAILKDCWPTSMRLGQINTEDPGDALDFEVTVEVTDVVYE